MTSKSRLEEHFLLQVTARRLPMPVRELRFGEHTGPKGRKAWWRFDFAWPDQMVAVEIQGGVWSGGAHGRGSGITRNFEKLNAAAIGGWLVLQGDSSMVRSCALAGDLARALASCPT